MRGPEEILEDILVEQRITNALLRATSAGALEQLLEGLGSDAVDGAIVRALGGGRKAAGILTKEVVEVAKSSQRTVQSHLLELTQHGLLQRKGAASATEYELTPLFSPAQLSRFGRSRAGGGRKED